MTDGHREYVYTTPTGTELLHHRTDGVVFTPEDNTYMQKPPGPPLLKWKYADQNSIDFRRACARADIRTRPHGSIMLKRRARLQHRVPVLR
jgi:hypothetical protein